MSRIAKAVVLTSAVAASVVGASGVAVADATADAVAANSPGVLSGNIVQVPIHIPVNICGNTVDVIGVLNPAFGNYCANIGGEKDKDHKDKGHKSDDGRNDDKGHKDKGHKDDGHNGDKDNGNGYGG
ncbi:chaplin [Streptomyces sp. HMX112]|uniref:chaplin n=1 Tax=Streptomyces sp. HMX112 TaxID=3390850 RepID=UPI003A8006FE